MVQFEGDEQYFFLAFQDSHEWLRPYLRNGCGILAVTRKPAPKWKALAKRVPELPKLWEYAAPLLSNIEVRPSDGSIEREEIDVMHFTSQNGFLTQVPSIFAPHDLQHLRFPEFFTPRDRKTREVVYRTLCDQAKTVTVMSAWGKKDLVKQFGLPAGKVAVIPWAPATATGADSTFEEMSVVQRKYALPSHFAFFPGETWIHKNHLSLLDALTIIKSRYGTSIPLVCTGRQTEFFKTVAKRAHTLGLTEQVHFLGFVSASEIRCLYRMSRCLIFPSRFEGWGLPLMEAFQSNTPAACSNISPMKEQAAGAALLFDPSSPEEIAEALWKLWNDEPLRQRLTALGKERLKPFTWDHSARLFRALYRKLGNQLLNEEDRALLAAPPLA